MELEDQRRLADVDARLWGKEAGLPRPYPLVCHLLDTAAMAGALYDDVLGPERGAWLAEMCGVEPGQMRGVATYWSGLHDIGKITPPFQSKVAHLFSALQRDKGYLGEPVSEEAMRFHHSHATQYLLSALFTAAGYPAGPSARSPHKHVAHQVAQMLGGHHGAFHARLTRAEFAEPRCSGRALGAGAWELQVNAHARALAQLIGPGAEARPGGALPLAAVAVLTGLVVCADWLASQESYILSGSRLPGPEWCATSEELRAHWAGATRDAPAVVGAAGLGRARFTRVAPGEAGFRQRFPEIASPNPLQSSLALRLPEVARGPGLLLVTAPTGDGKTEAAEMSAAHLAEVSGCGGLAFALPTQATTDAMFRRVTKFAKENLAEDASLALVHGSAWLSEDYTALVDASVTGSRILAGRGAPFATEWLRGRGLGVHAALGAMTIDQLLFGVLPVKHNMFRLYGLSGKVVVIDEAHSYGPWMHSLLLQLLGWLGAMRVPVVVMSATLAGQTAVSLLDAYRRGGGHLPLPADAPGVPYPGWVFLDAATGELSESVSVATDRPRALEFVLEPVRRDSPEAADDRLTVLTRLLTPLRTDDGCVLVCCNTVAEAQATYGHLVTQFGDVAEVSILHARFSTADRARITRESEGRFGKPRPEEPRHRPGRAIMIATQIVEQSIDLDYDLVISDLAPIAQLLQRAGRCRRHERGPRPTWTGDVGHVRMIVLDPVGSGGEYEQPPQWGQVYFEALLRKTRRELAIHAGGTIKVPNEVQRLIDAVCAETFTARGAEAENALLVAAETRQWAQTSAERQLAAMIGLDYQHTPVDLATLSGAGEVGLVDESLITTRLGADSARIVLTHRTGTGDLALLGESRPVPASSDGVFAREDVVRVMQRVVPVPGWWVRELAGSVQRPAGWEASPLLRDLLPVEGRLTGDGRWHAHESGAQMHYDGRRAGLSCVNL